MKKLILLLALALAATSLKHHRSLSDHKTIHHGSLSPQFLPQEESMLLDVDAVTKYEIFLLTDPEIFKMIIRGETPDRDISNRVVAWILDNPEYQLYLYQQMIKDKENYWAAYLETGDLKKAFIQTQFKAWLEDPYYNVLDTEIYHESPDVKTNKIRYLLQQQGLRKPFINGLHWNSLFQEQELKAVKRCNSDYADQDIRFFSGFQEKYDLISWIIQNKPKLMPYDPEAIQQCI